MYTKITNAKHGASAIDYVLQEQGHYKEKRNEYVTGVNLMLSGDVSITEQMEQYWNKMSEQNKTQVRRVVISFSEKEFDPENPESILRASELCRDGLAELYPDRQILVCAQTDGKGGKLHIHGLVNNVSMTDAKGLPAGETGFYYLKREMNRYMQEHGVELDSGKEHGKMRETQTERAFKEAQLYSWKDDLHERVVEAKAASESYAQFIDELNNRDIEYDDSRKHNTFVLTDTEKYVQDFGKEPEKALKARGKTLGEEFTKEALHAHFDAIQEKLRAEAEAQQAQQAAQMTTVPAVEEPEPEKSEKPEEPEKIEDDYEAFEAYMSRRQARRARRLQREQAEKQFDYTKPASEAEFSGEDEAEKQQEADNIRSGLEQILNRNKNIVEQIRRENEEKSKNRQDEDEHHV